MDNVERKDGFVSDAARELWEIFKKTGDINVYRLYHAVQYSDDKKLEEWANWEETKKEGQDTDTGMSM